MARKRTFSHFFFEKKCVFVPKSLIWLPREGRDVFMPLAIKVMKWISFFQEERKFIR